MSYPFLSLKTVTLDPALARRIPYQLALYHLVIPVAEENDRVTLVMAYPDNPKVVALLSNLLKQEIVPVQGDSTEIRATLELLYHPHSQLEEKRFLSWSNHRPQQTLAYTQHIAGAFAANPICIDASQNSLESVFNIAGMGSYLFSVIDVGERNQVGELLRQSNSSLFLLRGMYPLPHRILIVLQGHSPDKHAIDTVIALAQTFASEVTLLGIAAPMKRHHIQGIATLLDSETTAGQHLQACVQQIQAAGLSGYIKLRQGIPEQQIAAEFAEGQYDLMAIAVETYGGFVHRILDLTEVIPNPILAVKPAS